MNDGLMIAFLVVIALIGCGILFILTHGRKNGKSLNIDKYRSQWMNIERQLVRNQETSYHLAMLNADKLLDQALRQSGYKGQTMGERMKAANSIWSSANNVWTAHKIRNQIAHEPDVKVRYEDARRGLSAYKQGLKDLGAI